MTALAVRDLSFRYRRTGEELFSGLDHDFVDGQLTAVTGPSGRGKSTLLYLLGLMLRPTSGRVLLDGGDAAHLPDQHRARLRAGRLGFVFQDAELDPTRTILDAVCEPAIYGGGILPRARPYATALLRRFGLDHRRTHRPTEISGGQAQRVAICRALINRPAVILADEPTGNLDRANSDQVLTALADAADEGATVVIATHDPYVLEHAAHVVDLGQS